MDANAAVSEPKQPIVYWLDKNIPEKYRASVAQGVLEWNKAFEKAGFKNALVVKQQEATEIGLKIYFETHSCQIFVDFGFLTRFPL